MIVFSTILYALGLGIYNIYIHPLKSYPGPKLFAAYRLAYVISGIFGNLPFLVKGFHRKYGEVVRIAPDELAYSTESAWKDIYGFRHGHLELQKDPYFLAPPYPEKKSSIDSCNDEDHSRYRRLLSPAFSSQALSTQEPLIQKHVDHLITRLRENCSSRPQDIVAWYVWTTFDLIGDLAFGEPFGCLEKQETHPWVSLVLAGFSAGMLISTIRRYIPGGDVGTAAWLVPKSLLEKRFKHFEFARAKLARRMAKGNERPDFISYILRHNNDPEHTNLIITPEELLPNAGFIVAAGSETASTLLSGTTYYLLRNPKILAKATAEVRSGFENESDINFIGITSRMHYMLAVIDESFRMYAPLTTGLPRLTPPAGICIDGQWVPGNMRVSVFPVSASRSPRNFHKPEDFIPERWLKYQDVDSPFAKDKRSAMQPFSMGPRNCIGKNLAYMEMRLILAKLLWNFDLELDESCRDWSNQKANITWEKPPLLVRLYPAKTSGAMKV
jgi:cytochrome P450